MFGCSFALLVFGGNLAESRQSVRKKIPWHRGTGWFLFGAATPDWWRRGAKFQNSSRRGTGLLCRSAALFVGGQHLFLGFSFLVLISRFLVSFGGQVYVPLLLVLLVILNKLVGVRQTPS